MSGWIKMEKDLRDDPRFLRMVRAYVTHERCTDRYAATLLSGCLAQLWMYADSHVREDDTLDLGADEINELIGVEGFVQLMPHDWLEVIDPHSVKLPDFHAHNGTDAKKKALTAKRVERHRIRNVTQVRSDDPVSSNAPALPDQTRLDQTREGEGARAARPPPRKRCPEDFKITDDLRAWARTRAPDVDIERETEKFRDWEFRTARKDWPAAWRIWMGKAQEEGASRFSGGRAVPSPVVTEARALEKLKQRRFAIGLANFRDPMPGESADAYRAAQEQECRARDDRKRPPIPAVAALAAQKVMRA